MRVHQSVRVRSPFVLLASLLAIVVSAAGPKPLTTADLYKLRSVGDVQLSPDGSRVAYTIVNSDQPGLPYPKIWIADVANGESRPFAARAVAFSPRWSPDGKSIAYFGWENGQSGLFVARADGSAVRHIADVSGTNDPTPSTGEQLSWSPDSRHIAFVSATPGPEPPPTGDPVVITRYLYKPPASDPGEPFNDNRRLHIFIVNVATGAVRQLTTGNWYEHSIDWSPKGDEILFVSNREPDPDRVFNYDIFAARVSDGRVRRLSETRSAEYDPRWSPDGSRIAFLATTRPLTSSETTMEDTHVWVMDADGSGRKQVGVEDNRQGPPQWASADALIFTVQRRGFSDLARACLHAPCAPLVKARARAGNVGAVSVAAGRFAYAFTTMTGPSDLVIDESGRARTLTHLNDESLHDRGIADVESFTFKSFDGLEVEAFITKPLGLEPGTKHPLVVMIHGGPHGAQGPTFNAKAQIYAGAGFASLMVNYRGSTGYGQKFADAIFGDQDGGEAKDVLGGVSAAIAKYPWIDRNALFVEGMSYGGQLTNWIVTQTDRFKAAVSSAGISNLVSFNYMSYYHDYLAVEYGAYPHEKEIIDRLWERSPIRYAKDVHTPVMFIHGENDNDVPIAEAEQFYIALKDVGVQTVMVRYPREGHGLRETKHVADAIDRSLAWYRTHLR